MGYGNIMIIIIALIGAVRLLTISSLHRELSPTRTLKWPGHNRVEMCNISSTCHVQRAVCHLAQRYSSDVKFDRVETAFILGVFVLAETINR